MHIINAIQGSQEWHNIRAKRFTASEAPAMMGASKYQTRDALLKQKATGHSEEVSTSQQRIFDKGHQAEASARPIAEDIIGQELFPTTIEDDDQHFLASMDGLTMLGDIGWEHKLANERLLAATTAGELDDHYKWQMDQQMLVSGADSILFMCSDGTKETMAFTWYERDAIRIASLIKGWEQFEKDLADYVPTESKTEAVGTTPDSLPTLRIELTGAVSTTNLPEFKKTALAIIDGIKTELVTDQDFADADTAVKFLNKGEKQLEDAKTRALEQTASIDELFKTINELKDAMRTKRLALDKLVKVEKENRRVAILGTAKQSLDAHIGGLEKAMEAQANCAVNMPAIAADFAGAMKGKKTISSLESSANDTLATAKIEANQVSEVMRSNIAVLKEQVDFGFLFNDYQQLLIKANDDFQAIVKSRIAEHKEAQAKKEAADRERIRQEEVVKLKVEQDRKDAEAARQKAEQERQQAEATKAAEPAEAESIVIGVDYAQPGSDQTVQGTFTAPAGKTYDNTPNNDKVFNVAVNAVASYFDVTPAEAVDLLDAIDFSERKAS